MSQSLEITIPGQPQGKGRARFAKRGAFMRAYTPAKTVAYEGLIALAGQQAMQGRERFVGPVELRIEAMFAIPASWPRKRREAALWHTGRPDGDNILKAVGDGLNGIAWNDDAQVARCSITKVYGDTPGLKVLVAPLEAVG